MRINEILAEEQLDELSLKGLGQGLGRVPGAVAGGVVQGLKNVWNGAKQGYQAGQTALKPDANQSQGPSWAAPIPTGQGQPATAAPIAQPAAAAAPTGGDNEVDQILQLVSKLNPDAKKDIVSKIQAEPAAQAEPATQPTQSADTQQEKPTTQAEPAPTGTTTNIDPNAAANKLAKGQADQQAAMAQMKATQDANAAKSAADNDLVARVKAEKAKPGYDQDKGLLRRAAAQGIHENKKKKKKSVVEFHSRFLGMNL